MSFAQITLDNNTGHYKPGDTINGKIRCTFQSKTSFRAIKVRLGGKGQVSWRQSESKPGRTSPQRVTYRGESRFLRNQVVVYDATSSGRDVLNPGIYEYTFSFKLPDVLPSSYESTYGNIRYKIKGVVDRPWRFDYKAEAVFKVIAPVDLNHYPQFRNPYILSERKTLYSGLSNQGELRFQANLPNRGFIVGETAKLNMEIKNLSNVNVSEMRYSLTKEITYTVTTPQTRTKTEKSVIWSSTSGAIGANGEHNFLQDMFIPADTEIPNFANCPIFQCNYKLEITAVPKGLHFNLCASTNVIVGNIRFSGRPLRTTPPRSPDDIPYPPGVWIDIPPEILKMQPPPYNQPYGIADSNSPPPYPGNSLLDGTGLYPMLPPPYSPREDEDMSEREVEPSAPPMEEKGDEDFVMMDK